MKKRDCADCLYFIDLRCAHVDGTRCGRQHVKRPHWRPRPTDKLSPGLRRLVDEGEVIAERLSVRGANESELEDWNIVMDEYKAMKGGEG